MKKVLFSLLAILFGTSVFAGTCTWANTGTDMSSSLSYEEGTVPGSDDFILFKGQVVKQPYLDENMTIKGLIFGTSATHEESPCGAYEINGAEGKVLTLSNSTPSNKEFQDFVIESYGFEDININVPIRLTGSRATIYRYGGRMIFNAPLSTENEYSQRVYIDTTGTNHLNASGNSFGQLSGSVTLAADSPALKPERLEVDRRTRLMIASAGAISDVRTIFSKSWSASGQVWIYNLTGKPLVLDNLTSLEGDDNDGLHFEGDPFIMTNCVFSVSVRDNKWRSADAEVWVKNFTQDPTYNNGCRFATAGTNLWVTLGKMVLADGYDCYLNIVDGMHYCPAGYPTDHYIKLFNDGWGDDYYPTIGIDKDSDVQIGCRPGAVCFGRDGNGKKGGFSAVNGNWHIRLLEADMSMNVLTNYNCLTSETNRWCKVPNEWVFGNAGSSGTIILDNDVVYRDEYKLYAFDGKWKAPAGRFAGVFTVGLNGNNHRLHKKGNGSVAFENYLAAENLIVYEGGILINCPHDLKPDGIDVNGDNTSHPWIGGTGTVNRVYCQKGGCIRAGEYGVGSFTIDNSSAGSATMLVNGCGLIVDITTNHTAGCLILKGGNKFSLNNDPNHFIRVCADKNLGGSGRVKIMDWTDATNGDLSMTDPTKYTIEIEEGTPVDEAHVYEGADKKSMWLSYHVHTKGFKISIR